MSFPPKILSSIDAVVFDLDGTVYNGNDIINGANDTILFFRSHHKKVFFITNNSTKTRHQIYEKLIDMNIGCYEEEILSSGMMAALYVKKNCLNNIFILGSTNLKQEFISIGINECQNDTAENIVIGYDPYLTYDKLTKAVRVALNAKCMIACNKERTFPGENAIPMPGCGAMTASVEWCANRQCDIVIGKPSTFMLDYLIEEYNLCANRILVIGDTYASDIIMAQNAGANSILIDPHGGFDDVQCINEIKDLISLCEI